MTTPSPKNVRYVDLLDQPQAFAGQLITTTGVWHYGMEHSEFGGAWLTVDEYPTWLRRGELNGPRAHDVVSLTGVWRCNPSGRGYGHMGLWGAEIRAPRAVLALRGRSQQGFEPTPFELPDVFRREAFESAPDRERFCAELSAFLTLHIQGAARPAEAWLYIQNALFGAGYGWAWDMEAEQERFRNDALVVYTPFAGRNPLDPEIWDYWESPYQFVAVFGDARHDRDDVARRLAELAPT